MPRSVDIFAAHLYVPNPFARYNPGVEHTASVRYSASVERADALHEVVLEVSFSYYCGGLCAMAFTHRRRVTFDEQGTLLSVEGDGPPGLLVS